MVLSWNEMNVSRDGTGMVRGVAEKSRVGLISIGVAWVPKPCRARSLTLLPGIGMEDW